MPPRASFAQNGPRVLERTHTLASPRRPRIVILSCFCEVTHVLEVPRNLPSPRVSGWCSLQARFGGATRLRSTVMRAIGCHMPSRLHPIIAPSHVIANIIAALSPASTSELGAGEEIAHYGTGHGWLSLSFICEPPSASAYHRSVFGASAFACKTSFQPAPK